jgi:hypothetical protein
VFPYFGGGAVTIKGGQFSLLLAEQAYFVAISPCRYFTAGSALNGTARRHAAVKQHPALSPEK